MKPTLEQALAVFEKRQHDVVTKPGSTRRIVLYRDASVAKDTKERAWEDILFDIPIPQYYFNKPSRLLFCYNNGHVNVMRPKTLLEDKLKLKGIKAHGFKQAPGLVLMNAFVCKDSDFIVIYSYDAGGVPHVKAMELKSRKVHERSMDAAGNIFVKESRPYKWMVIPHELQHLIRPIFQRTTGIGTPLSHFANAALLDKLAEKISDLAPDAIIKVSPR